VLRTKPTPNRYNLRAARHDETKFIDTDTAAGGGGERYEV
jgi:hypothetical protein